MTTRSHRSKSQAASMRTRFGRRRITFEQLQSRELLAADLDVVDFKIDDPPKIELLAGGELRVTATNDDDEILVKEFNLGNKVPQQTSGGDSGDLTRIDNNGETETRSLDDITHGVLAQVKNQFAQIIASKTFAIELVSSITVLARNGDDVVINDTDIPSLLDGGLGASEIYGGGGNDTIYGSDRPDFLYGRGGVDYIWSLGADDHVYGGAGGDVLHGGDGADYISGESGVDTIHGGDGADRIYGGHHNDFIYGDAGDDRLFGEHGHDELHGGRGADHLFGGEHNDTLAGNENDDTIYGGDGEDTLYGGRGDDTIYGQRDVDTIFGGDDADYLYGGHGGDEIWGEGGHDHIWGGDGNDVLHGGDASDHIYGEAGRDKIFGDAGRDLLDGGLDGDWLYGGDEQDFLTGSAGDDELYGEHGADTLDGGLGDDLLRGGDHNDSLFGGGDNDRLLGEDGDDTLSGQAGNDSLFGGLYGVDISYGGDGADRFLDADDDIKDQQDEDARLIFKNGGKVTKKLYGWPDKVTVEAGWWSNDEIETVDLALGMMHAAANNTSLLKTHNGKDVTLYRHGVQTAGSWSVGGWNGSDEVAFVESTFSSTDQVIRVVLHEFGHFKDDENPNWDDWKDLSGWKWGVAQPGDEYMKYDKGDTNWWFHENAAGNFARDYGQLSPLEDFATTFAAWFMTENGMTYPYSMGDMTEKFDFMEQYVASL